MKFKDGLEINRAMVIYAHPDDAEFGFSGTAAKWSREGVEIIYCMVTNGASGSSDPDMTREKLAKIRRREQLAAAELVGVKEVVFLGFEDGYLYPDLELRKAVAREIRRWKPDTIVTQDPTARMVENVYINHPDHMAVGEVVMRSINPDASSGLMFPELWREEGLEPHKPGAVFIMSFMQGDVFVDVSDLVDLKIKALQLHESQIGDFDIETFIRERNGAIGREAGCDYAEAFKLIWPVF